MILFYRHYINWAFLRDYLRITDATNVNIDEGMEGKECSLFYFPLFSHLTFLFLKFILVGRLFTWSQVSLWIWSYGDICVPSIVSLVILIQNVCSVTLVIVAPVQILGCLFNTVYLLAKSQPNCKDTFIMFS